MKSDYRIRAQKFLRQIFPYIADCLGDVTEVDTRVWEYAASHSRKIACMWGSARCALITSDYVIKWDYGDDDILYDIGGCEDEIRKYEFAVKEGYAYLLAEISRFEYGGHRFYIMPRIPNVGSDCHTGGIESYLSAEEYYWLTTFCDDLHDFNWGVRGNKACVIDYAYDTRN